MTIPYYRVLKSSIKFSKKVGDIMCYSYEYKENLYLYSIEANFYNEKTNDLICSYFIDKEVAYVNELYCSATSIKNKAVSSGRLPKGWIKIVYKATQLANELVFTFEDFIFIYK